MSSEDSKPLEKIPKPFLLLPTLALFVVASIQMLIASNGRLSPWKGGGFGMFSTIDSPGNRKIELWASGKDGEVRLKIPRNARRLISRIRQTGRIPNRVVLPNLFKKSRFEIFGEPKNTKDKTVAVEPKFSSVTLRFLSGRWDSSKHSLTWQQVWSEEIRVL